MTGIVISELNIHPIKSIRRVNTSELDILLTGAKNDRRLMIVDNLTKRFITQRDLPLMARLSVSVEGDVYKIQIPGQPEYVLKIRDTPLPNEEAFLSYIHSSTAIVVEQSKEVSKLLTHFLGVSCSLVGIERNSKRAYIKRFQEEITTDRLLLSDAAPLLLTSESSLNDLNKRLPSPLPMDRFRSNIVISGSIAYEEDNWSTLEIGGIIFDLAFPCTRCQITTVDQEKGVKTGVEPLATLAKYRLTPAGVRFGILIAPRSEGKISLGQNVKVL